MQNELGIAKNQVKLVDYDPYWNILFKEIKTSICAVTSLQEFRVQHIGSTAISNIKSKPVIDILLGVDHLDQVDIYDEYLKTIGFYRLKVQRENEYVYAKFKDTTFEIKTHFIHMVPFESDIWKNLIFFRDYLNSHPEKKIEYQTIKQSFVNFQSEGIQEYTAHKEAFIKNIFTLRHSL